MNGLIPNMLADFVLTNTQEQQTLELILSRRLPFPFNGKSGILLHGVWGTGKTTLAHVLPGLLETAYEGNYNTALGVSKMPAAMDHLHCADYNCGATTITKIIAMVQNMNQRLPIFHLSQHDYVVLDEVDRLSKDAQQSLRGLMDLKRVMYFMTTNSLGKVDPAVIDRCHLVELNQPTNPVLYMPFVQQVEQHMSVPVGTISVSQAVEMSKIARGSMRVMSDLLVQHCLQQGGNMPAPVV
jgi:replication-associated recombination protein RarA